MMPHFQVNYKLFIMLIIKNALKKSRFVVMLVVFPKLFPKLQVQNFALSETLAQKSFLLCPSMEAGVDEPIIPNCTIKNWVQRKYHANNKLPKSQKMLTVSNLKSAILLLLWS